MHIRSNSLGKRASIKDATQNTYYPFYLNYRFLVPMLMSTSHGGIISRMHKYNLLPMNTKSWRHQHVCTEYLLPFNLILFFSTHAYVNKLWRHHSRMHKYNLLPMNTKSWRHQQVCSIIPEPF
jgi:hypothetical protein